MAQDSTQRSSCSGSINTAHMATSRPSTAACTAPHATCPSQTHLQRVHERGAHGSQSALAAAAALYLSLPLVISSKVGPPSGVQLSSLRRHHQQVGTVAGWMDGDRIWRVGRRPRREGGTGGCHPWMVLLMQRSAACACLRINKQVQGKLLNHSHSHAFAAAKERACNKRQQRSAQPALHPRECSAPPT